MKIPENVLISRIDSIGDVVLALPVAGELKKNFPGIKIGLVGALYTKPVIEACEHIDTFIDVSDFIEIENDAYNLLEGRFLLTDLNGDNLVDITDITFVDNNSYNYVSIIRP